MLGLACGVGGLGSRLGLGRGGSRLGRGLGDRLGRASANQLGTGIRISVRLQTRFASGAPDGPLVARLVEQLLADGPLVLNDPLGSGAISGNVRIAPAGVRGLVEDHHGLVVIDVDRVEVPEELLGGGT